MSIDISDKYDVAVLVPCYNEEQTIGDVVKRFRETLPHALIYVFDNNSSDMTALRARSAGAIVIREPRQGKGNVIRRMFADIDADIYVLADGDLTYDAPSAPAMVEQLVNERLDMVVGARVTEQDAAYRPGHQFGNRMLTSLLSMMFGRSFSDILTGYRVFSRRFVKSFPVLSRGFEIETEISVHALELSMPLAEVSTPYGARPEGSASKLSTWSDGFRILRSMIALFRSERPLLFFGVGGALLALVAMLLAVPLVVDYAQTGLVPRMPTAILVTGMMVVAVLSLFAGLILDTVTRGRREMKRFLYLQHPAPEASALPPGLRVSRQRQWRWSLPGR